MADNARDPLRGVHGGPPGVRRTPGSMRRKGVITGGGSCTSPVVVHCRQSAVYGDPYQNDQILTRGGFSWIPVRRTVRKEDSGGSWTRSTGRLECLLFLFTRGWILVDPDLREEDPVQWITGIR